MVKFAVDNQLSVSYGGKKSLVFGQEILSLNSELLRTQSFSSLNAATLQKLTCGYIDNTDEYRAYRPLVLMEQITRVIMLHDKRFEPSIQTFDASAKTKSRSAVSKQKRAPAENRTTRQYRNSTQRFLKLDSFI